MSHTNNKKIAANGSRAGLWSSILGMAVIAAALFLGWYMFLRAPKSSPALDKFAQCVAAKGATMYGAAWCPHCQQEKKDFGTAFRYIPYVECPDNPSLCTAKNVTGYPTWIFGDGSTLVGEQSLSDLAKKTGCELPKD